jgi:PncC family amidohydrolase
MSEQLTNLVELLKNRSLTISVAESCTGGNLSALLTSISGSSSYFNRGYITYSDKSKIDMLGVNLSTINEFGAVSEQTAIEMSRGLIDCSLSEVGVAVTGIAGPTGGTKEKPVGTVCFSFCILENCFSLTKHFNGDRNQVVHHSVNFVIETLINELSR